MKKIIFWLAFSIAEAFTLYFSLYPIYFLNETQLMYVSSTGAQVIAALFGLTITGYIFFDEKLNSDTEKDDTLIDVIYLLKKLFRSKLIRIGVFCFLAILLCLIIIILGMHTIIWKHIINNILLNNSILFVIVSVLLIIEFVFEVVDPRNIQKISLSAQKAIDSDEESRATSGDLANFLKLYNEIERMINDIANEIVGSQDNRKMISNMYQDLKILVSAKVISESLLKEIDSLRKYRNYVVHGLEMSVSVKVCREAERLRDKLKTEIEVYRKSR